MPKKTDESVSRAPPERPTLIVRVKLPPRPLPLPPSVEEPEPRPNKRKEVPASTKSASRVKESKERVDKGVVVPDKGTSKSMQKRRERQAFDSDEEGEVSHDEKRARVERGAAKAKPAAIAAGKKAVMAKSAAAAPSSSPITKDIKRKRVDESSADLGTKRRRAIEDAEYVTEVKKENMSSSPGSGSPPPARGARDSNGAERTQKAKLLSRSSSLERESLRREDERRAGGGTKGIRENVTKNNSKLGVIEGRRSDEVKREKVRRSLSPENESSLVVRQRKGGEKEREGKAVGDVARSGKEREKDKDKEKASRRNSARSWSKDRGRSWSWSPPRRDRDRDRDRGRGRDGDRDRRDRDRDNRGRRRSLERSWDKSRDRSKDPEKGGRSESRGREREREKERERNGRSDRDKDKDSRKTDKEKDQVSPATSSSTDRRSSVSSGGTRRGAEGENGSAKDDIQRKIVSIPLGSKSAVNEVIPPYSNQTSSVDRLQSNTTPPPVNSQDARSGSATATISVTPSIPVTPSRKVTLAEFKKQNRKSDQGTTPALTNGHETDSSVNTPKDMESPVPGNPRTPAPSAMPIGADLEQTGSQGQVRLNGSAGGSPPEMRVKKESMRTLTSNQGHAAKDYVDKWRIDSVRYRELGDSYKHQADKTWQTSEDLASVQWMEALFSYMQSFYHGELSNEQSAVGAWHTLIPLLKFLKTKHKSLHQLAFCKIESIVLFHIFSLKGVSHKRRLTRILSQLKAVDATSVTSGAPGSLEAQRAMIVHHLEEVSLSLEEFEQVGPRWSEGETHLTHEVLRRDFPDTWQRCIEGDVSAGQSSEDETQRFEWPMTHYTSFPRLVAFGRCLLREYADRKNVPFVPIKDY
ncbi:hypothetical protein BC937DRAFT_94708 [Endogone sp. FLAS-F59071]|nr:hypothetical protein BC937DRAFT_94708 [Endogone sp. FLAS-F59071]|eukprot:RUS13831.1 hypothetical protein BC937DRAFT_94708 [Endogone sp. FLAS-F59071]